MWTDEMIPMLRYLINDIDATTYTNTRLQTQLAISARYVNQELFENYYTVSPIGSGSISPDPTVERNENFINLTVLRAGCDIGRNEFKLSAGQAISIRDGSSALDLKGTAASKEIVKNDLCSLYANAKSEYLMGAYDTSGGVGAVIFNSYNFRHNEGFSFE